MSEPDRPPLTCDDLWLGVSWLARRQVRRRGLDALYVWSEPLGGNGFLCAGSRPAEEIAFALECTADGVRVHVSEAVARYATVQPVMIGYRLLPRAGFAAGSGGYGE